MTGLLEKALKRIEVLPETEQDAIAWQLLEILDDEEAWERTFQENREKLEALADKALEAYRRGDTLPIEEILDK